MAIKRNSETPFSAIEKPSRTAPPRLFYNYTTPNWSKGNANRCQVALCSRLIPHIQECLRGTKHEGLFLHTTKCTLKAVSKDIHSNTKSKQKVVLLSSREGSGRFLVETEGQTFIFELILNSQHAAQEIFTLLRGGNRASEGRVSKKAPKSAAPKKTSGSAEDPVLLSLYEELDMLEKKKREILDRVQIRKKELKSQVADLKYRMRRLRKVIDAPTQ